MIYTFTLSPALDYVMNVPFLSYDDINRASSEKIFYGGKGINVSSVLHELQVDSVSLGFIGGFTGKELVRLMANDGLKSDFTEISGGNTRINVKLRFDGELDINAAGPVVSQEELNELFKKLDKIKSGDCVVLSGSVPSSLPDDIYEQILERLSDKDVRAAVDTTGKRLLDTLCRKPFLIKPNHHELAEMFGKKELTYAEITEYGKELQNRGAQNVLVSCGEKGAVLIDESGRVTCADAVRGRLINSVGCGDSMVAGFLAGMELKNDIEYAFRLSVACSAATAFSEGLGKKDLIYEILKKL